MGWIPDWPTDPVAPKGALAPVAITLHRTHGHWPGDYAAGKTGLFQFLIGQEDGQRVQFMSTTSVAWHANGANLKSFGVELTGTNEDPLTDWQVANLGEILRYAHDEHGIPLDYVDPITQPPASIHVNNGQFFGVISHISVRPDDDEPQHEDFVTVADFDRAVNPAPPKGTLDMVVKITNPGGVVHVIDGALYQSGIDVGAADREVSMTGPQFDEFISRFAPAAGGAGKVTVEVRAVQ